MHKFILGNVEKSQHKQKKDICIKKRKKIVDQFCCRRMYGQDEQTKQKITSRD